MRLITAFTLFVGVLGAAMASEPGEPPYSRWRVIDKFVSNGPVFLKGKNLGQMRALAPLRNEKVEEVPNPHVPGRTVEFRTLTFDGLVIYGDVPKQNTLAPIRVVVTSAAWKIEWGLSVGAPIAKVGEVLGEPSEARGDTVRYCGETDCVTFAYANGRVLKIEFNYYAD